ncbi:hypothetical protein [Ilumatobacter sp.]|uniref:hypothetical protein n=1 Tax=Ilumatobacter sp. TaxID=1967498 RepID=UPI003B52551D
MARLVITNRGDVFDRVVDRWRASGLEWTRIPGTLFVAAARKRRIVHRNTSVADERSWVVGTGTYATWDGRWEDAALDVVASRFDRDDPSRVRDEVLGHYALAVRRDDRVAVMCDEVCSAELFLTERDGDFVVATALGDVSVVDWIDEPIDVDGALLAAFHGHRGIAGRSAVHGVAAIRGHQFVDLRETPAGWTSRLVDGPPVALRPAPSSEAAAVEEYTAATERLVAALATGPDYGVNVTGGLDSRLVAAAAHRFGSPSRLLYGAGNSAMTNTRRQDLTAARSLSAHLDVPLTILDWRQDRPWTAVERAALRDRFGFSLPYGATAGVMAEMAAAGPAATIPPLQLGGYSPGFTNKKVWEWTEAVDAVEFARRWAAPYLGVLRSATDRHRYLERMAGDLESLADQLGVARHDGRFGVADAMVVFGFAYVSKDAFNTVAFNEWAFALAPHMTSDLLLRVLSVPPEWRRGDRFQLALIRALDPEVLSIPVFSGTRPFRAADDGGLVAVDPRRDWTVHERATEKVRDLARSGALRTRRFRRTLLDDLRPLVGDAIDPERLVDQDLRAVFRFVVAREVI